MALQSVIELILAVAAMMLLGRDLLRAWRDPARRPMSLLVAALVAVLFFGTRASGAHPNPWWMPPVGSGSWGVHGEPFARGRGSRPGWRKPCGSVTRHRRSRRRARAWAGLAVPPAGAAAMAAWRSPP